MPPPATWKWVAAAAATLLALMCLGYLIGVLQGSEAANLPPNTDFALPKCAEGDSGAAILAKRIVAKLKSDQAALHDGITRARTWFYVLTGGGAFLSLAAAVAIAVREGLWPNPPSGFRFGLILLPILSTGLLTAATQFDLRGAANVRARNVATVEKLYGQVLLSECKPEAIERIVRDLADMEQTQLSLDGVNVSTGISPPVQPKGQ